MISHFRQIRQSRGMTLHWLASQLGVHRATLTNYETGKTVPPKAIIFLAASLLHVSPDDLLEHAEIHS